MKDADALLPKQFDIVATVEQPTATYPDFQRRRRTLLRARLAGQDPEVIVTDNCTGHGDACTERPVQNAHGGAVQILFVC